MQIHLEPDGREEDRRQDRVDERLQPPDGVRAELGHLTKHGPGDEGPEDGVDADPLGGGPTQQGDRDEDHEVAVGRAEAPGDGDQPAAGRVEQEPDHGDEDGGQQQGDEELAELERAMGGQARDDGQHQPAGGVIHDTSRQDHHTDVAPGEVEIVKDLGDDGHGRDGHGGREKQAEQDASIGLGQIGVGDEKSEAEAGREGEHHPHGGGDERGATQVAQQAQVRLQPGEQQQQHHAQGAHRVEQQKLGRVRREEPGKQGRGHGAEQARSQHDPGRQLAQHRGQGEPPAQLRPEACRQQQHRHLQQEQKDGVSGQWGRGRGHGGRTLPALAFTREVRVHVHVFPRPCSGPSAAGAGAAGRPAPW